MAQLVQSLKTDSSQWIKAQRSDLAGFALQRGYGSFSVGPTHLQALIEYIDKQEAHHRRRTYEEEVLMFLKKYKMEYDEGHLWD